MVNWRKFPPGLAYVCLSRSQALEDLFISGTFDPKEIKCQESAKKESLRLDLISLNQPEITRKKMREYLESEEFKENPNQFLELQNKLAELDLEQEEAENEASFAFLNIRSLNKHYEDLTKDRTMMKFQTIFVVETWMLKDEKINMENYYSEFANQGRGKGVGVFYKIDSAVEKYAEELFQFIKLKIKNMTIFCAYVSKGCNWNVFKEALIQHGFEQEENVFLVGDLNFDQSVILVVLKKG